MLQKNSYVTVSDSCGVWNVRIFHIYKGFQHKLALTSDFVKVSVRKTAPTSWLKKGKKSKALVIRTRFRTNKCDGSFVCSSDNSVMLLKKRMTPRGKELLGPITYGLRRRKVNSSFIGII